MRRVLAIAALAACLAAPACAGGPEEPNVVGLNAVPNEAASIIGDITQVEAGPRILVEQIPTRSAGEPIAWVGVNRRTVIVERTSTGSLSRGSLSALAVGTRVQVWFTGVVLESFPVQATAGTILIER